MIGFTSSVLWLRDLFSPTENKSIATPSTILIMKNLKWMRWYWVAMLAVDWEVRFSLFNLSMLRITPSGIFDYVVAVTECFLLFWRILWYCRLKGTVFDWPTRANLTAIVFFKVTSWQHWLFLIAYTSIWNHSQSDWLRAVWFILKFLNYFEL